MKDKKIALLGMGLENVSLAVFLYKNGVKNIELRDKNSQPAMIGTNDGILKQIADPSSELGTTASVQDDNSVTSRFGDDYLEDLDKLDVIFRTPGIPYLTPEIQEAKKHGVVISSQIKLFFDLCPAQIIGVTGTKGKGTASKLIQLILSKSQETRNNNQTNNKFQISNSKLEKKIAMKQWNNVYLLGNIGETAVDKLESITKDDIVILELSSFQLQDLDKSPHVAVITNLGEDHLDYHSDINEYWSSKINILKHQSKDDLAVINQDFLTTFKLAEETPASVYYFSGKNRVENGAYVREVPGPESRVRLSKVILTMAEIDEDICDSDELQVVGRHNLENIAAASVVAKLCGVETETIRDAVLEFKGLEHRLEFVAKKRGVKYYNDSYATNPISTIAAINSFKQPEILILGGSEKGIQYNDLAKEMVKKKNIKAIVYIGETGEKIASILRDKKFVGQLSPGGQNIEEIIKVASSLAKSGEVVLFSPASASFGLFKNYKDRGEKFKKSVLSLK